MIKKCKNILIITVSVLLVIALVVGITLGVCLTIQMPKTELDLSSTQRKVLTQNFDKVELGQKKETKRVIDNTHPLNLLNFYGNEPVEDLWSSIPENQKPYTVLLIIPGHTLLPGTDGQLKFLEETADKCENLKIPYAIQNINGEIAMEERLPIAYLEDRFASQHEYFYGLNGAELYNSITWRGEVESNNSQYIIDMIKLCTKYGAFFFWTDTNMNYDNGMLLEWFETNELFYSTFKEYSKYICLLNKESYGKPSTYACMQGLWLAGLVGNWGVASDWWHWQVDGDKKSLFDEYNNLVDNEWDMIFNYPEQMYVQSMALVMSAGGTCFKAEAPNFSTSVGGKRVGGFEYGIAPLFDRVIDGRLEIPSREEVLRDTPVVVMGYENYPMFQYDLEESNLYPHDGRYGVLPLVPKNLRKEEIQVFNDHQVQIVDSVQDKGFYDSYYADDMSGDTYLKRMNKSWYFINNSENKQVTKHADFAPVISSASRVSIAQEEHSLAIITEKKDSLGFYVSNYRTDKKKMVQEVTKDTFKDMNWVQICGKYLPIDEDGNPIGVDDSHLRKTTITIKGTYKGGAPKVEYLNKENGEGYQNRKYTHTERYDIATQTLTIEIMSNGVVELNVLLDSTDKVYSGMDKNNFVSREIGIYNVDTSELKQAIDKCKLDNNKVYNEYSLLQYNAAIEQGRVAIAQGTYTQEEVNNIVDKIYSAYGNLLDITMYADKLESIDIDKLDSKTGKAFDKLLRESISNSVYVDGRSQKIDYVNSYKNKDFDKIKKEKALDKKYNALIKSIK